VLGHGRRVVVARELTKKFETILACRADRLPEAVGSEPRGEYVLLIDAAEEAAADVDAVTAAGWRRWPRFCPPRAPRRSPPGSPACRANSSMRC